MESDDRTAEASRPATVAIPTRTCACLECAAELHVQTIHQNELQSFQRTSTGLKIFQHDCLQLAELAIASVRGTAGHAQTGKRRTDVKARQPAAFQAPGLLSFAQHHAVQKWKDWLLHPKAHAWRTSLDLSTCDPNLILQAPIAILNELFFLAQLPLRPISSTSRENGHIRIQWSPPGTTRRAHSHTIHPEDDESLPPHSVIWINPHHPSHFLNTRGLLNTVLHELCHVFLQRFSCYNGGGEGCEGNQACLELCRENYGATGHGRAWQVLSAAIEEAAPKLLGGWRVDLGREECAVREMWKMGAGWWPPECDLARFAGEFGWKLRSLMRSRDTDRVVLERARSWVLRDRLCPIQRQRPYPESATGALKSRRRRLSI